MSKFYFNIMTETRFTLIYSRIHSAQACSSKVEWEQKQNFYTKGWFFPFPPPIPLKVSVFFPHFVSNPGKLCYDSRQQVGFFSLLFVQTLPKWTEGRCYFTSTDFQKKTLIPWSTHALPLKSRFWAQKEIVCIYFIWLSIRRGCLGWKRVFTKTSPNYTIFSASFNKA